MDEWAKAGSQSFDMGAGMNLFKEKPYYPRASDDTTPNSPK